MSNNSINLNSYNFFQKNLVPLHSKEVRIAMKKAASLLDSKHYSLKLHCVALGYSVKAVSLSFFYSITYLVTGVCKTFINVVDINFPKAFKDLAENLRDAARSFSFVALGIFYIGAVLFAPRKALAYFKPIDFANKELQTLNDLKEELETLKEEKIAQEAENEELRRLLEEKKDSVVIKQLKKQRAEMNSTVDEINRDLLQHEIQMKTEKVKRKIRNSISHKMISAKHSGVFRRKK